MSPERYELVRELYHELADESEDDRRRILADRNVDADILEALEELLGYDEQEDAFEDSQVGQLGKQLMDSRAGETLPNPDTPMPSRLGPFEILRKVGEGGMGVVYAARRDGTDELIALKMIRPGLDTGDAAARFRREAGILRRLEHPGIAAFHEAGQVEVETAGGTDKRLYLAMELVSGEGLFHHVETQRLLDNERLELFARICDAVQHAHEHGIVHRDLKPGNVLVAVEPGDPVGLPKVMDFGVARVTNSDSQTLTMTDPGVLLGTVPYMSPEQISGRTSLVSHRTDIYSLGVLAYEILVNRLPYPVRGRPLPEMARVIQEHEPQRLGAVEPRFRGDVETILAKALEKEPHRRYSSAAELSADIRNHLAGQPIEAQPPTWYRIVAQAARQHRMLTAGVAGAFLMLLIGLATTLWFAFGAMQSRDRSQDTAYQASITAAAASLELHDVVDAGNRLENAPLDLRRWEWHHLSGRLDDSLRVHELPTPIDDTPGLHVDLWVNDAGTEMTVLGRNGMQGASQPPSFSGPVDAMQVRSLRPGVREFLGPDGRWLYRLQRDQVSVIDALTGELHSENTVSAPVSLIEPSGNPDRWIAQDDSYWTLHGSDAPTTPPRMVDSSRRMPGDPVISKDGSLVVWQEDGLLRTWRPDQPESVTSREVADPYGVRLWVDPMGQFFVRAYRQRPRVELWKVPQTGPPTMHRFLDGHRDAVRVAAFSNDGQMIATAGEDRVLRFWGAEEGEPLGVRVGHRNTVLAIRFLDDDQQVATVGGDQTVRFWQATGTDPRLLAHTDFVYSVEFDPEGRRLYTGSWDGRVRVFDAASGASIGAYALPEPGNTIQGLALHPREPRALAVCVPRESSAFLLEFDLQQGTELRRVPLADPRQRTAPDYSPAGDRVVYQVTGHGTYLMDTSDWSVLAESPLTGANQHGCAVRFDDQDRFIAAAAPDHGAVLCDSRTLEVIRELTGPEDAVAEFAFSPDGEFLAAASHDWKVYLWDVDGGEPEILDGHVNSVYSLSYSPDGTRLATAGNDRTVRLWQTRTRTEITRIPGHLDYVYCVRFGPEGQRLATGSGDRTAGLWGGHPVADRLAQLDHHREQSKRLGVWIDHNLVGLDERARRQRVRDEASFSEREREIAFQVLLSRRLQGAE